MTALCAPALGLALAALPLPFARAPGPALVTQPVPATPPGWRIERSAGTDLWFHAMALVGERGFGAFPWYDPGYRGRQRASDGATPLNTALAELVAAIRGDSALEVLHFVPVYFPTSGPKGLLEAVAAAATGDPAARNGLPAADRFGAGVLAATLTTPQQRQVLARLARTLDREPASRVERVSREDLAQAMDAWARLEPALRPLLVRHHLERGLLLATPALGAEGRFFDGRPDRGDDNVVIVGVRAGGGAELPYFAVRELCYPVVRLALAEAGTPPDRVLAERLSGIAAVRCGALWLERAAPALADRYREAWLRIVGAHGSFEDAFPLPASVMAALERALVA